MATRTRRRPDAQQQEQAYGDEDPGKTNGRWQKEEHDKFVRGKLLTTAITLYGKDWKKVEQHIGTRSGA